MSHKSELIQEILAETRFLTADQRRRLDRMRSEIATNPSNFTPRSATQYLTFSSNDKKTSNGQRRIEYILTREIEYLLLAGSNIPKRLWEWLLSRQELLTNGVFGSAGIAAAYYQAHHSHLDPVVARYVSGVLFSRSGLDGPVVSGNILDLQPAELFTARSVDPAVTDQIVQMSLQGGLQFTTDGDTSWRQTLVESMGVQYVGAQDCDLTGIQVTSRGRYSTNSTAAIRDEVDCSVFAPPSVKVGCQVMISVYIHTPDQKTEVRADAREIDPDLKLRQCTSLGTRITRGSKLTFEFDLAGFPVDERCQSVVWEGRPASLQFLVDFPATTALTRCFGRVVVSQDTIPIGIVKFWVDVVVDSPIETRSLSAGHAIRFQSAFVSYASQDCGEVLRSVKMLEIVGIDYFADLLSLEAGVEWEQEIFRRILDTEVLLLFWSSAAKRSQWVSREWSYALSLGREGCIIPVIIEGPPPVEPPPELAHLHFNDRIQYFIAVNDRAKSSPDP